MPKSYFRKIPPLGLLALLLIFLAVGCPANEAPLSPGAASFKQEVNECIARLSQPLIGPIVNQDLAAIEKTLDKVEPEAIKLCRMCPFTIAVINSKGDTLALHPPNKEAMGNFSDYAVVREPLKSRRAAVQRFFLQNGSQIFIIGAPILKNNELVGLLALALSADEAQKRWGLTEKEFEALNFNR